MILYLSLIGIFIALLSFIDILCGFATNSALITILLIVGATLLEVVIDGFFAFVINKLPNKWFEIDNKFYNVSNNERKFYEKIKIRKWKDKVWELGSLGGFSKKSLQSSSDINYLKRFIVESNKGVLTHIVGCIAGFLILPMLIPFNCVLHISLPVAIVNFLFNIPSLFILRYNTPKLLAGYKRLLRTSEIKKSSSEPVVNHNESLSSSNNLLPNLELENSTPSNLENLSSNDNTQNDNLKE